jgi:aminodeoxyfutalosine deaminase
VALRRIFPPRSSCRELTRAPPIEEALVSDVNVKAEVPGDVTRSRTFPKIELHVHLEGTVRARSLLRIARRNDVPLPAEAVGRGSGWDEVFAGYCDGARLAAEQHGVQVRLTPDIPRGCSLEIAELTARHAVAYRDRGVVGIGLGGPEAQYPPEAYARAFEIGRDGGLGSVPHAGEAAGPSSVRGALDTLRADRIRHGVRAADDPGLLRELAARGVVLDVCPISNLRTGVVSLLADHPLPVLAAAGVACSVSTDDPAMFDTDLSADYAAARELGVPARECYAAGQRGALCDEQTKSELQRIGDSFDWDAAEFDQVG